MQNNCQEDSKQFIRLKALECFYRNAGNDAILIKDLQALIDKFGSSVHAVILQILTCMDLPSDQASIYWQGIIDHRDKMSEALGREVKLRTALCDYFCSVNKTMKNPVVIELNVFEDTLRSARHDAMTGLYNRRHLDQVILQELQRSERNDSQFSVLFLDLDDFKKVNDTYGHLAGDTVLIKIAEAISREIRLQDIAARYGGEEIVIILPETNKVTSLIMAERIKSMVADLNPAYEGQNIPITISGGLATFPIDSTEPDDLVKCADLAMFQAKKAGKNQIVPYSQNKRRYLRLDYRAEITVQKLSIEDSGNLPTTQHNKNISLSGLLFSSKCPYELGTRLLINLPLKEKGCEITLLGTVVRTEYFDSSQYDIGVAFLDLDESSRNQLTESLFKDLNLGQTESIA